MLPGKILTVLKALKTRNTRSDDKLTLLPLIK